MARHRVKSKPAGNRGMALLLVVTVIALLSVVIIGFNRSMQHALAQASRFQDQAVLESLVDSGMDIGLAVLQNDALLNDFDSYLENWARLEEAPLDLGISQGELHLSIIDLDGRFPLHSLVRFAEAGKNLGGPGEGQNPDQAREILLRLLQSELFVVENETQAREIVDSLVDWLDADDDESNLGAESNYYESLEKLTTPRNGQVDFIEELLQVKGITRELLYGNDEKQALAEYVSVVNRSGKININTAPVGLIQALDERITSEELEGIDEYRKDEANAEILADSNWIAGYLPGDIAGGDLLNMLSTNSTHFLVESEGRHLERFMTLRMIVERSADNEMKVLSQRVR